MSSPHHTQNVTVISLKGQLAGEAVDALTVQLRSLFKDHHTRILLDVVAVEDISHAGFTALYRAARYLMWHNGKLALLNPSDRLAAVMHKTGLGSIIASYDSKTEALKQLAN